MFSERSSATLKTILACTVLASSLTFGSAAHAGTCKTVEYFPGVVQVFATAKDTTGNGDSALCSAVNACPAGARKIEVFGAAGSTKPGASAAVSNFALLADGDAIATSCETTLGQVGRIVAGVCQASADTTESQGDATQQECTVYATTPAGGQTFANATCFCGE